MPRTARTQAAAPDAAYRSEPPEADRRTSSATSRWEFPGCRPIHLSRDDVVDYDGRFEFWDAELETAWVMEPTSPYHESPSQILAALVHSIAAVRGSPIRCFGAMDLLLRDAHGERRRILQADQVVYLHPVQANLPGREALVIGEHAYPDVVMEVDYSTDARPSKLGLYASWGFPEVWLEVPEERPKSRPRGRESGLTIHVLDGGAYRVDGESRAFPGWTAGEIHAALNERECSAETCAVLERVGTAMGAREGTGPDDDPLLRSQRRQGYELGQLRGDRRGHLRGRLEGLAEGRAEGLTEGLAKGRAAARGRMVRGLLLSRGIEVSDGLAAGLPAECDEDVLITAALACESEADFLVRVRERVPRC